MAIYDLDFVIEALHSAFCNAQSAVRRQQEAILQRVIDVGEDGEPKYLTWMCRLPSGDGGERAYEMVRMPFACLRSSEMMDVSELSMEFDCDIRKPQEQGLLNSNQLIVLPRRITKKRNEHTHSMRITLIGECGGEGNVTVDGMVLKGVNDHRFLLCEDDLNQVIVKNRRPIMRLFGWKPLYVWFLIGLLVTAITALLIQMEVVRLH
jgi:hypothetical protein